MLLSFRLPPRLLLALLLLALPFAIRAQTTPAGSVGIGTTTPDPSAALDVRALDKGLLIPRLDSAARVRIAAPAPGLLVFQTSPRQGFYYYSGTSWQFLPDKTRAADNLGDHTATRALNLNGQRLTGGGTQGLRVRPGGGVVVDSLAGPGEGRLLSVASDGTLRASPPLLSTSDNGLPSASPVPLGMTTNMLASPVNMAINPAATRAYVINAGYLQAYDISNPNQPPVSVGDAVPTTSYSSFDVAVNPGGTRAYVVSYAGSLQASLQMYDITDPNQAPKPVADTAKFRGGPRGIAINRAGTRAYVITFNSGLLVFDISDPNNKPRRIGTPVPVGSGNNRAYPHLALNPAGTRVYVTSSSTNQLFTFDISDPNRSPLLLGEPVTTEADPGDVAVNPAGTRAYVVCASGKLQVFNISDLTKAPEPVGNAVTTTTAAVKVVINPAGTHAYLADQTLRIFDIQDPDQAPTPVGNPVPTNGRLVSIAINPAGTLAYTLSQALQVFRLTDFTLVGVGPTGALGTVLASTLGDNLGNHMATQNLNLGANLLVGSGSVNVGNNLNLGANKLVGSGSVNVGNNLNLGANLLVGSGSVNVGNNLNLGTNKLVGNGGSRGLNIASTGLLTLEAGLRLPFRSVAQTSSFQNVDLSDTDYTVRSGTPAGVTGGPFFSFILPSPVGRAGRVFVLLNAGHTPANLYSNTAANSFDPNTVYDDAVGNVYQVPASSRLTLQSDGGLWMVISR